MGRPLKFLLGGLAVLILLPALLLAVLVNMDWNRARPWLADKVSEATGRAFAIEGDLRLHLKTVDQDASAGWRARIPWPHLEANQVVLGNPEWATTQPMATVGKASFSINPLALISRQISIPTIVLHQPVLVLERSSDGRNNWTLKREDQQARWKLDLGRLELQEGRFRLIDGIRKADIRATLNSIDPADRTPGQADYKVAWSLEGKLEGENVSGHGRAGPLLALRELSEPYPLQADLKIGESTVHASGTVSRPRSVGAVDVALNISGPSMAKFFPIAGVLLPETPPFATNGRLKGQLGEHGGQWKYENFSGKVGESDLSGTLEYRGAKPRALLTGTVTSRHLRFEDLGPLIGAGSGNTKVKKKSVARPAPGRVLPVQTFKTSRWKTLDANVKFTGRRIVRGDGLPLENVSADLQLKDGVLQLAPLRFGMAGGTLDSRIKLDGSQGKNAEIQAELDLTARSLKIAQLFPKVKEMQASVGAINGHIKLSGSGDSIAALLASSSGEVNALLEQGTVSKFLLEAVGLNVGSMLVTKLFGDKQVVMNCMASRFQVKQGVMQTRGFVLDTEDGLIHVEGDINLARESLNLVVLPETRGVRLFSLRSPIFVRGTFAKPAVEVDRAAVAAKAGASLALGVLAPAATALLPLINPGGEQQSPCQRLLERAKQSNSQRSGQSGNR